MKIKTVSIIGVGAVGAVVAWKLRNYLGKDNVEIIVEGERKKRYEENGLFLNGEKLDFKYVFPNESKKADLLILATKNLQLEEALKLSKNSVGVNTLIMSLLNGIQSECDIAKVYGEKNLIYSFVLSLNSIHVGNKIECSNFGEIIFGEKDNSKTDRTEALCNLFENSKIKYKNPDDIHLEMWKKFLLNVTVNSLTAITRSGYGAFKNQEMKDLALQAGNEVVKVANAVGVGLTNEMLSEIVDLMCTHDPKGKTSMFQDVEAKRKTENEWLAKTVVKLGKENKIPTPTVEILQKLISVTEYSWELMK